MKINKNHFISRIKPGETRSMMHQPSVFHRALRHSTASAAGEDNFNVKISVDNQNSIRVTVLYCNAITPVRIILPALSTVAQTEVETLPTLSFDVSSAAVAHTWWAVLLVHPFRMQPAGSPDISENPPGIRWCFRLIRYRLLATRVQAICISPLRTDYRKIDANGSQLRVDENYIPACYSLMHTRISNPSLRIGSVFGKLKTHCIQMFKKFIRRISR
jgi:hypothetical protein